MQTNLRRDSLRTLPLVDIEIRLSLEYVSLIHRRYQLDLMTCWSMTSRKVI